MFNYWQKQQEKPLFPDILWSRPENKALLPRLAIISGSKRGFADGEKIYASATKTGLGACKILLPDVLKVQLPAINDFVFIESTKMGSFSKKLHDNFNALKPMTSLFIITESSGKESETVQSIHKLIQDDDCDLMFINQAILANDQYLDDIIKREAKTTLVLDQETLQKVASRLPLDTMFRSTDGLAEIVKGMHSITAEFINLIIVAKLGNNIVVGSKGQIYSTQYPDALEEVAAKCASFHDADHAKNYIVALSSEA